MRIILLSLSLVLMISGCGKKGESSNKKNHSQSESISISGGDSDGDGFLDEVEVEKGMNPLIADIPSFSGDFFKEMEVKLEFYNKSTYDFKTLSWSIKGEKIKFSWLKDDFRAPLGSIYMDTLLKNYAINSDFKKNGFSFSDYNEGIYSHSSPVLFEDSVFEISKKILANENSGYEVNRVNVVGLANIAVKSKIHRYYRDPVFDIYYKSRTREGLTFVESKKIEGTYQFNSENKIYFTFDSSDKKLVYDAFINGGSSFFVRLRDFAVYETQEWYSDILARVKTKSIPVSLSISEDKNSTFETVYVGTNGKSTSLHNLLATAFNNEVLVSTDSVDQIGDLRNRTQSYEYGQNEIYRWFVGTNGISNNVFKYNFRMGDGVIASYLSDKRVDQKPIYTHRSTFDNNNRTYSTSTMPSITKNIKIRLIPTLLKIPYVKKSTYTRSDCGRGLWDVDRVTYERADLDWKVKTSEVSLNDLSQVILTLKDGSDTLIAGSILDLTQRGYLEVGHIKEKGVFDITFKKIILSKSSVASNLLVQFHFVPYVNDLDIFPPRVIKRDCVRGNPDRSHGADGGPRFGITAEEMAEFRRDASGFGFAGQSFENQMAFDTHIFSY